MEDVRSFVLGACACAASSSATIEIIQFSCETWGEDRERATRLRGASK